MTVLYKQSLKFTRQSNQDIYDVQNKNNKKKTYYIRWRERKREAE